MKLKKLELKKEEKNKQTRANILNLGNLSIEYHFIFNQLI